MKIHISLTSEPVLSQAIHAALRSLQVAQTWATSDFTYLLKYSIILHTSKLLVYMFFLCLKSLPPSLSDERLLILQYPAQMSLPLRNLPLILQT